MQVIPSIDVEKISDLHTQLERLAQFYGRFQIDFADGQFVNFTTPTIVDLLNSLILHKSLSLDIHLMTLDYQRALELINKKVPQLNIAAVFVHHASNPSPAMFLDTNSLYQLGLVLNPEDSVDTIKQVYNLSKLENIQLMSIHPGPQGTPFLPETLNKVEQLRHAGYKNKIFLDGGVNEESLKTILSQDFLPDFICPGSYFSRAKNIEERVQYLSKVLTHESNSNQNT